MRQEKVTVCGFQCVRVVPIRAGRSSDEKYDVTLTDGRRCMLRISPEIQSERKKAEYGMMETAWRHGIRAPRPYAFGKDGKGNVYQLIQWLDGRSLEEELSACTETEKYDLGVRSGQLLKRIHAISAAFPAESWKERFKRKIEIRMSEIEAEMIVPEYMNCLCQYLLREISILDGCGQCFNHGDFYPGNLMHLADGSLAVIDFNAYNGGYGDPVFEMASVLLDRNINELFKRGFRNGYYGSEADGLAERLLEYYRAYILLAELCETEDGSERDDILARMHELAGKIMT